MAGVESTTLDNANDDRTAASSRHLQDFVDTLLDDPLRQPALRRLTEKAGGSSSSPIRGVRGPSPPIVRPAQPSVKMKGADFSNTVSCLGNQSYWHRHLTG